MSREQDQAIDRENEILAMRIMNRIKDLRNRKIDTGNQSGLCWNCDEPIGNERRFCDSDCRDDWQRLYR